MIQWFAAVIPAHPDIQRRAQQELDCVVGRGRLPTVKDEAQLPYCRAIIKEVERCYNPAWLGTPHMASDDFVYNGHLIPKGTVVLLNTWTMHHDATRWESPMEFSVSLILAPIGLPGAECLSLARSLHQRPSPLF